MLYRTGDMWRYVIGVLIILIAFVTCGKGGGASLETEFVVACKLRIEDRLRSPSTAEFSESYEQVQQQSNGYRWAGTVDSQNGFGAMIRSRFICTGSPERPAITLF